MFILQLLILILDILPLFFSIIMFFPINKYKIFKTKEDQLFLQKCLITLIFFSVDIIINVLKIIKVIKNGDNIICKIEVFIFNVYIIALIFYNFFLSIELYSTFSNPVHLFNRLFKQKKYNYVPEFFILIISVLVIVADSILYKKFDEVYINDNSGLIMPNYYKCGVIVLFSFISIILCIVKKSQIKKFSFKNQEKLINLLKKRAISNVLYLIYGGLYAIPLLLKTDAQIDFNTACTFVFLMFIIMDFIIHISLLASTKFCEYRLKKSIIGYICSLFYKPPKIDVEDTMIPLINDTMENDTTSGFATNSTLQADETSTVTQTQLISNSPADKELISIYKNNIFIEDYFLNFFDQILNIVTISIFQVYYSKYFSSKANDSRLSTDIKIDEDVSGIVGSYTNRSVSVTADQIANAKCKIGDYTTVFDIKKNLEKDDYSKFKDVLENGLKIEHNNNYINTKIKSFFTPKCVETIYEQKLKGKQVGNSLLSHLILTGNKNKNQNTDNANNYFWSLTASNGKEQYFNKLKNTTFKTYDKNFNLDIFDSNDDEIIIKKGKSSEISLLIDKYFTYIHGKGINGTFIPSLVGIFKVKINNFKTLLVFITRNSLVENAPKNFFTYWQLVRFLNNQPEKIASSQFNDSGKATLVKDDPLFERLYHVDSQNENPDFNKINLKNFSDFQDTIKSDIAFLSKCGSQNFELLLMYFEYENTQKHEKQGAIKIQKLDGDKAEIIQASYPKDIIDEFSPSINPNNNMKFPGESMKSGMFSLGGAFLDGGDEDLGVIDINKVRQNAANLMEYSGKFSMNGYEGVFDSFNCMCFFSFENIFDIRKRFSLDTNYYKIFQDKILNYFTSFKK